jgi:hypothetical protein
MWPLCLNQVPHCYVETSTAVAMATAIWYTLITALEQHSHPDLQMCLQPYTDTYKQLRITAHLLMFVTFCINYLFNL